MAQPKPIEIARMLDEKKEHLEHEDAAHRLMGIDLGEDFLICSFTKDGKVIIPGQNDD